MATLSDLLPGGRGAPFVVALGDSQYLTYHLAGALLTRLSGDAVLANKLLLAATAIAWPFSFRALLRALGRDPRLALFSPMLFWSRPLAVGFLPFVASIPIALATLALTVRALEAPSRRRIALLALSAVFLFYTHASSFLLVALVTAAMVVAARPPLRRVLAVGLALAPSAVLALAWWRRGSLRSGPESESVMVRMSFGDTLNAMPLWSFDIWRGHTDELCAVVFWLAFALLLFFTLRSVPRPGRGALVLAAPFFVTLVLYFASPFSVGLAGYLNLRLAPFLVLFALLWVRLDATVLTRAALSVVAIASAVSFANASWQARAASREHLGDLDAVLDALPEEARVATLNFSWRSPRTKFPPYVFAASYHRARGGAESAYSFAEMPHWSVHYAEGAGPPAFGPLWTYRPCAYTRRAGGARFDHVLVQGAVAPFEDDAPGPRFARVAARGAFTLYRRTGPEPTSLAGEPDRSVCAPAVEPGRPSLYK